MTDDPNSRQEPQQEAPHAAQRPDPARQEAAKPATAPVPASSAGQLPASAPLASGQPAPAKPAAVPQPSAAAVPAPQPQPTVNTEPASSPPSSSSEPRGSGEPGASAETAGAAPPPQRLVASPVPQSGLTGEEMAELVPELPPMFPGAAPFLARFLPQSAATYTGLHESFCDLHAFLKHLHEHSWYGYLYAVLGEQSAYVLLFEGRTVTAAAAATTGEQALGELLNLYEQGASLSAHPLSPVYAHVLSGIGSRAWKFNLTEDFTGLHARPTGAIFYARGEIVATLPATLPYEGAFPAPLRPQTLILPRSLAGWAHHHYTLTLRGKDARNAITDIHQGFRRDHGAAGLAFLQGLGEKLTPAEYAMRSDAALHDLEPLVKTFLKTGYIREV